MIRHPDHWSIYCDGSGTYHSDSPACIGTVIVAPNGWLVAEMSRFIELGSNNVAELRAIQWGLELLAECSPLGPAQPAVLYSDSIYALGIARGDFTPKANHQLCVDVQWRAAEHAPYVTYQHVKGHAGIAGNELADWLAGLARRRHLFAQGGPYKPDPLRPVDDEWLELSYVPRKRPATPRLPNRWCDHGPNCGACTSKAV
jgi:ribonuclease HI